jgi:hypothetical protein
MIDDDDFLDDPDDDAPRDANAHAGVLSVPGIAPSLAVFDAMGIGFRRDRPVIFVATDEDAGEIWLDNRAELVACGFTGQTIADAEEWLSPKNDPPNPERDAALRAALKLAASPTAQPKWTEHGPPRK